MASFTFPHTVFSAQDMARAKREIAGATFEVSLMTVANIHNRACDHAVTASQQLEKHGFQFAIATRDCEMMIARFCAFQAAYEAKFWNKGN